MGCSPSKKVKQGSDTFLPSGQRPSHFKNIHGRSVSGRPSRKSKRATVTSSFDEIDEENQTEEEEIEAVIDDGGKGATEEIRRGPEIKKQSSYTIKSMPLESHTVEEIQRKDSFHHVESDRKKSVHFPLDQKLMNNEDRAITDLFFLVIIICIVVYMILLCIIAIAAAWTFPLGDLHDSWGNTCGQFNSKVGTHPYSGIDARDKRFLFFPNWSIFAVPEETVGNSVSFCIRKCPSTVIKNPFDLIEAQDEGIPVCGYDTAFQELKGMNLTAVLENRSPGSFKDVTSSNHTIFQYCPLLPVPIHGEYRKFCIPSTYLSGDRLWLNYFLVQDVMKEFIKDIFISWKIQLVMAVTAFSLCYLLMALMQTSTKCAVRFYLFFIISIFTSSVIFIWIATFETYKESNDINNSPKKHRFPNYRTWGLVGSTYRPQDVWQSFIIWIVMASVFTVLLIIVFIFLWCIKQDFLMIVSLMKEGCRVFKSVSLLICLPMLTVCFLVSFMIIEMNVYQYLMLFQRPVFSTGVTATYHLPFALQIALWLNLFTAAWVILFILSLEDLIATHANICWYLDTSGPQSRHLVLAFKGVFRYHIGTAAFSAFVLMFIWLPRSLLRGLFLCSKEVRNSRCIALVFGCFWFCLEEFLNFLNRDAFAAVVLHGMGYFESGKYVWQVMHAAKEKFKTAKKTTELKRLTKVLLFFIKLSIVPPPLLLGFILLKTQEETLTYLWAPLGLGIVLSFLIAHSCFIMFEVLLETSLVVYFEERLNSGVIIQKLVFPNKKFFDFDKNRKRGLQQETILHNLQDEENEASNP